MSVLKSKPWIIRFTKSIHWILVFFDFLFSHLLHVFILSRENPVAQADVDGPELEERGLSIDERAREVIEYLAKRYICFTYYKKADR